MDSYITAERCDSDVNCPECGQRMRKQNFSASPVAKADIKRPKYDVVPWAGVLRLVPKWSASVAYDGLIIPRALLAYLERLTASQGRRAGQAFTVLPWESRVFRVYGDESE